MADDQYVVFKTPTTLDMRAITTFGLNAKPNSKSPIGYFGTGLKMAIAVLIRNKIPVRLFIGDTEYEFREFPDHFRGVEYSSILMRKRKGLLKNYTQTQLPFTTELAKNWTLWQAFRELESNTRDEEGETSTEFLRNLGVEVTGQQGYTTFIVGPSPEFAKVYEEKDKIFLPEALKAFNWGDGEIQIFKKPSNYLYYRGIRIHDLTKPSIFTYNVLAPIDITEDRTAKYDWGIKDKVQRFLARQEDQGLINQLLNATEGHWESTLSWDSEFVEKPSAVFLDVLARRVAKAKGKSETILPRFTSYHSYASPPPMQIEKPLHAQFQNWYDTNDITTHLDQAAHDVFEGLVQKLKNRGI